MKKVIIVVCCLVAGMSFSQKLNAYKYAIIPERFEFQKSNNQYNLNELAKAAMKRYGFECYFNTEELPVEATNSNKVFLDILENNSMIYTKLTMILKDHRNNILFTSPEGQSKEKDYDVAYNESFRMAVKSVELMNHHYSDAIIEPETTPNQNLNQVLESSYVAKSIKNGYNLMSKGNVGFQIFNTSKKDVFIAKKELITGILLKIEDQWFFEYYKAEQLILEKLNITFQ